jgi:predicted nucleic acid-binding protein
VSGIECSVTHCAVGDGTSWVYKDLAADDRIDLIDKEPAGLEAVWAEFAVTAKASAKLWMDAYLAAFPHSAGYTLVTTDIAFTQFPELDLRLLTA